MCLLLLQFRTMAAAPVLVAANREEFFNRPTDAPSLQPGSPRVLCGSDRRAGGTWLGVNEHGLVVGVTNRMKGDLPAAPRSRGLLCRELLDRTTATEALEAAHEALARDPYAGVNVMCADRHRAVVVHAGDRLETVELPPGVHLLTNADVNDPTDARQVYARSLWAARFPSTPARFVEAARQVLGQGPDETNQRTIILRGPDRGTVSSSIIALTSDPTQAAYWFAPGSPDQQAYDDLSPSLRELLGGASVKAAG